MCAALAVLTLTLSALDGWRTEIVERRHQESLLAGQAAVWQATLHSMTTQLNMVGRQVAEAPQLSEALGGSDLAAISRQLRLPRQQADGPSRMELIGSDGRLIYSTQRRGLQVSQVFDSVSMDRVLKAGTTVDGIQQDTQRAYYLATAWPVHLHNQIVAAVTLALPIDSAVRQFARSLGGGAFMVDLRGNVLAGDDAGLWATLDGKGELREGRVLPIEAGEHRYSVGVIPIAPQNGTRTVAHLITVLDRSDVASEEMMVDALRYGAPAVVLVLIALILAFYLCSAFRPLERGVALMSAVAAGDTSLYPDPTVRHDEVGRIANAVGIFRENIIARQKLQWSQARQRRRQTRFIRQQMIELASALERESREQMLEDLHRIETALQTSDVVVEAEETSAASRGDKAAQEFGLLAVAFRGMTHRVQEQYVRLDRLIAELREALAAKTQFIALQQELEIARLVQHSILPADLPASDGVSINGTMHAAKEVGGDFYDFFNLDADHVAVAIADVSGKGVPAALFMAISRTLLRATAIHARSPAACITAVNELLAAENEQMLFVTMFYGILNRRTLEFRYVNAGHNPPMYIDDTGAVHLLEGTGGIALAVMDDMEFAERSHSFQPGDTLFLYTDGVTEAFDIDGVEFTEARLVAALEAVPGIGAAELPRHIVGVIKNFERGALQADDITCVALKIDRDRIPVPEAA